MCGIHSLRRHGGLAAASALLVVLAACVDKPTEPEVGTQPGSNWWTYQVDLANSGRLPGEGLATPLEIAWEREIESTDAARTSMFPPVFGDGKVLAHLGLNPGVLHALSAEDGSTIWSFRAPAGPGEDKVTLRQAPAVANGQVYGMYSVTPESGPTTSRLYALDEDDGTVLWSADESRAPQGAVKVASGLIFAVFGGHSLRAFSQNDGEPIWTASLGEGGQTAYTTPAVAFGNVIAADTDGVYAFRANTGSPEWSYAFGETLTPYSPVVYADVAEGEPPVLLIAGTVQPLVSGEPSTVVVRGLSPVDGSELWRLELVVGFTNGRQSVAAVNGKVFLLAGPQIFSMDVQTGALDLTNIHQAPRRQEFPPAVSGAALFYTTGAELQAISVDDASLLWETTLSDGWTSSEEGLAIDQGLLVVTNRGRVVAFRPAPQP